MENQIIIEEYKKELERYKELFDKYLYFKNENKEEGFFEYAINNNIIVRIKPKSYRVEIKQGYPWCEISFYVDNKQIDYFLRINHIDINITTYNEFDKDFEPENIIKTFKKLIDKTMQLYILNKALTIMKKIKKEFLEPKE
jgi:hypothetical protein